MGNSRMSQVVVVVAILLGAAWLVTGRAIGAWLDWSGTPTVVGTSTFTMGGMPGRLFTLLLTLPPRDAQWNTASTAAFHVLVVACADSLTDQGESKNSTALSATWNHRWNAWTGARGHERAVQHALATRYSAVSGTVRLGDQRYSLKEGNLFVVRFDERGRMSVRQLPQTFLDPSSNNAMTMFETLLPGDADVQSLLHWDAKPPCLRRPASPPSGAST
jgi:hypothetical protein